MPNLELLSVVAVLLDLPDRGLVRGRVGTVVEILTPAAVLVDFSDLEGKTYAIEALDSNLLIGLHHQPLDRVA
jgi:hypothetical protein